MMDQQSQIEPPDNPTDYLDRLLTEAEAADFVSYTVRALQNWRLRGGGPSFIGVSGRSVRYRRRDLLTWIESKVRISTADTGLARSIGRKKTNRPADERQLDLEVRIAALRPAENHKASSSCESLSSKVALGERLPPTG